MTYTRKTKDTYILYVNYGYGDGYEEEIQEETKKEILIRLKEYRENCPQYHAIYRKKRELI